MVAMKTVNTVASEKLSHNRLSLLLDPRFQWFGYLGLKLELKENRTIERLRTNGSRIEYNPDYVMNITDDEALFGLGHEILHCALGHVFRLSDKDKSLYNQACDYVINQMLIDSGFTPIKNILLNPKYKGMSAEDVYADLYAKKKKEQEDAQQQKQDDTSDSDNSQNGNDDSGESDSGSEDTDESDSETSNSDSSEGEESENEEKSDENDSQGKGDSDSSDIGDSDDENDKGNSEHDTTDNASSDSDDSSIYGISASNSQSGEIDDTDYPENIGDMFEPDGTSQEQENKEQEWKVSVVESAMMAQQFGNVPGFVKQVVEKMTTQKLTWKEILADFVQKTAMDDYSWNKPNRSYLQDDLYVPDLESDEIPEIIVAIDTSGSTVHVRKYFLSELSNILASFNMTVRVLDIDTVLQSVRFFSTNDLPITDNNTYGNGGTTFIPAFQYIEQEQLSPVCLIYFTDCWGTYPLYSPSYPVIWISTSDIKPDNRYYPPFGEYVYMDTRE